MKKNISIIFCFLCILLVFVPWTPTFPSAYLDPSWVASINYAISHGMVFGRDILFTYGPYAPFILEMYSPETYAMGIATGLYMMAVFLCTAYILAYKKNISAWVFLTLMCILSFSFGGDSLLLGMIFLIGLAGYSAVHDNRGGLYVHSQLALIFTGLGFLSLVKGTALILVIPTIFLLFSYFILSKRFKLAFLCVVSPLVSIIFFWSLAGRDLADIFSYFFSLPLIVDGYSEAMALFGRTRKIVYYALLSFALLLLLWRQRHEWSKKGCIFLVFLCSCYLFLSFKEGFVRHDGHDIVARNAIITVSFGLMLFLSSKKLRNFCLLLCLVSFIIPHHSFKRAIEPARLMIKNVVSAAESIYRLDSEGSHFKEKYKTAIESIRSEYNLPLLAGTSDIYSYRQAALLYSGNTWNPRPVFQSYSVYTPRLANINIVHLLNNATSPDNIFFNIETIDNRLESLDDGASWPVLLSNYSPNGFAGEYLILKKNQEASSDRNVGMVPLSSGSYSFGEKISVPPSKTPVFMKMNIKKSFWGKFITLLFKPSILSIELEMDTGEVVSKRIVSTMIVSGAIISPRVIDTHDFSQLCYPDKMQDMEKVVSVNLPKFKKWIAQMCWEDTFEVEFSALPFGSSSR